MLNEQNKQLSESAKIQCRGCSRDSKTCNVRKALNAFLYNDGYGITFPEPFVIQGPVVVDCEYKNYRIGGVEQVNSSNIPW
jgi:hypothetical protein